MMAFAARRIGFGLFAIWAAATLAFLLAHFAPGGPAVGLAGEFGAPGYLEEVSRVYGLDRPLPVIYADWLRRLLMGDLGISYREQAPVLQLIADRAPVTLAVMLPAIVLAAMTGLFLGLWATELGKPRRGLVGALAALHAMPSYVVAHGFVLLFALGLGLLPVQGLTDARIALSGLAALLDVARHLVLPILALATVQLAFMALIVRARVLEEVCRPYIVTAQAKGADRRRVLLRHALPNAALPIVTLAGWRLGTVLGGSIIIETVFALPGLGRLAVTAAIARDHPTVIGIVLVASVFMVTVNLLIDLLSYVLHPRLGEPQP